MSWLTGVIALLSALVGLGCLCLVFFGLLMAVGALGRKLASGRKMPSNVRGIERDATGLLQYHQDTEYERVLSRKSPMVLQPEGAAPTVIVETRKPIAVLSFDGTIQAKGYREFAKLVDEIEINRNRLSEVVVRVTSPGGTVPEYGYLCAEMERIRNLDLPLTVCVDTVAASGGYLMSLPATRIVAAPFAAVGSIGVVAFVPNARKLLERIGIDPRVITAGKLKRTLTTFDNEGPDSEAHKEFQSQLESIHRQFTAKLKLHRPSAKIDEVTTGKHWSAQESVDLGLGLVDEISTSSAYLLKLNESSDLVVFSQAKPYRGLIHKLTAAVADQVESRLPGIVERVSRESC